MASILIADDHAVSRFVLERQLARAGHRTASVQNGAQALEALENGRFDLLLLDVRMPVLDGVRTVHWLRASQRHYARIPILAVTACAMSGDRERFLQAGMNEYLSKPFTRETLLACVERLLALPGVAGLPSPTQKDALQAWETELR